MIHSQSHLPHQLLLILSIPVPNMAALDTASFLGGQEMPTAGSTPGFFTAAMTDGNDNIFERSFLAETDQRLPNVSDAGSNFFQTPTTNDFSFNPFQSHLPYPNPYLASTNMTPPPSAKDAPQDWLDHDLHEQESKSFPHSINTHVRCIPSRDSRLHFGQATPPDDDFSMDFDFANHEQKPQLSDQAPKLGEDEKVKSSSKASKAAKRTRKSTRKPRDQEEKEEQKPLDEKRHKFLERNRVAASKCRQKKKEYTQSLEDRARTLDQANRTLRASLTSHEDEYQFLVNQMLKHTDCSCTDIREFVIKKSQALTSASASDASSSPSTASSGRPAQPSSPAGSGMYGSDSASSPAASSLAP